MSVGNKQPHRVLAGMSARVCKKDESWPDLSILGSLDLGSVTHGLFQTLRPSLSRPVVGGDPPAHTLTRAVAAGIPRRRSSGPVLPTSGSAGLGRIEHDGTYLDRLLAPHARVKFQIRLICQPRLSVRHSLSPSSHSRDWGVASFSSTSDSRPGVSFQFD